MRDFQRSKVYQSQDAIGQGKRFYSLRGVQSYVDSFIKSAWWKRRSHVVHIYVHLINNSRAITAYCLYKSNKNVASIHVPKCMFRELVVLHELSHILTPTHVSDHGADFCTNFLDVVNKKMGIYYKNKLIRQFDKNGVKYTAILDRI